ncbi:Dirigent protein 17 [Ananas comosus]|uniref:Dirigent protein 17 n=1 Tax=Ananas comosus TaxID=4615 RepID=A0A199W4U8_ANACO|nr:Dirigent protein 17 [Ananas comosus]
MGTIKENDDSAPADVIKVIGEPAIVINGRQVRKLFGDRYYSGKVVEYDDEMNWYRIVYEDGDLEDLDACSTRHFHPTQDPSFAKV